MAVDKSGLGTMMARLVLTVAGVLLMIVPPFSVAFLNLSLRLQASVLAAVELVCLAAGLVLLYLGFKEKAPSAQV